MPEALITQENASLDLLKSILEAALMECSIEDDVLVAREVYRCVIHVSPKAGFITLTTSWGFKDGNPLRDRLELANRINHELPVVKASIDDPGSLVFEYDLLLDGGITHRAFATAVRRYLYLMREAIHEHGAMIR